MAETRQRQLDSLRTFAVLLVLWQHTMRPRDLVMHDAGYIGVVIFFVLSGFLITGILLTARVEAEAEGARRSGVLRRFYIRRFLRIFPLYYGVIAVAWLMGDPQVRAYIGWLTVYGTNFLMAKVGGNIGMPTPFWSLAIEEQFYLFWPCVVLFAPKKRLPLVMLAMIALSVATRFFAARTGAPEHTITMPTWSALDGLAIGGLLAYAYHEKLDVSRVLRWTLPAGVLLLAARLTLIEINRARAVQMALWMLPWAMIGVWLVDQASRNRLPRMFNASALAGVGVISYGVYVYHRPMMSALDIGQRRGLPVFALITVTTLAVAAVSWRFFEKPINDQKRRWPYVPRNRSAAGDDGVEAVDALTAGAVNTSVNRSATS